MGYQLGVDLGTTFSAVAIARDGAVDMVPLGYRSPILPSVLLARADGSLLVGDAAERRAFSESDAIAREFKRRIGDPAPYLLAGRAFSPEELSARLLRALLDRVTELEGGPPDLVALTHPANWGQYRKDQLTEIGRLADVGPMLLLSEPEAAAISYASAARVEPGSIIATYDLGGGTFDAAVLAKSLDAFEVLGQPEGIERLGGVDFDAAVWAFVNRSLDGALDQLDAADPAAVTAAARLRADCVAAKETLSVDTVADIAVILPGVQSVVRMTRADFEQAIRPALEESVSALQRSVDSASLTAEALDAVVLIGGSSRIPLVAQVISESIGAPIALDAHPKHAVALGGALAAARRAATVSPVARPLSGAALNAPPVDGFGSEAADALVAPEVVDEPADIDERVAIDDPELIVPGGDDGAEVCATVFGEPEVEGPAGADPVVERPAAQDATVAVPAATRAREPFVAPAPAAGPTRAPSESRQLLIVLGVLIAVAAIAVIALFVAYGGGS